MIVVSTVGRAQGVGLHDVPQRDLAIATHQLVNDRLGVTSTITAALSLTFATFTFIHGLSNIAEPPSRPGQCCIVNKDEGAVEPHDSCGCIQ